MVERILIVEDEEDLAFTLEYNLKRSGYQTVVAHGGEDALRLVGGDPLPDLMILDLMLPDMDGVEICRRVRSGEANPLVPILMLTARGDEQSRVEGFEAGADDYVVKPFSVQELLLRIQAILRRANCETQGTDFDRAGGLEYDRQTGNVRVDGAIVDLSRLEFRLLLTLLRGRGRVQSREDLIDSVWSPGREVQPRTVDVYIKRLRTKLGDKGEYIHSVRGSGYRFLPQAESEGA